MKTEHTPEPIAYRLTNTSYRKPHFEYFTNKEEAERRQFEFNRSVDDGGLYNLTPLWGQEYVQQLERESSACDMVAELIKQRDELLAALESNQSRGVRDVIVERRRQINIEGWSSHHDDQHSYGEMALAAGCYAMFGLCFNAGDPPKYWPWDKKWWKPSDKRRNLVKAAALIIAEIERIDRAAIASVKGGA